MKMTIQNRFLTFPVNKNRPSKKVMLRENGELVFDLDIRLDNISPSFTAYVDVSRFLGKELTLSCDPEMPLSVGTADEISFDDLYREPLRPDVHFTVKNGWNNDPNGLCYHNGVYHMYFQYNPCDTGWGNMHWGHAVSRDLLHWEEKDIALAPDENGTMYSGCALIDRNNLSGLGNQTDPVLLYYYTAAGARSIMSVDKKTTQRLAYFTDGGETLIKYPHAILDHIISNNRDPKVAWVAEMNAYVMILYLDKNDFRLFRSTDLFHWEPFQTITICNESECPNLIRVRVKDSSEYRWVIFGANGIYIVGSFRNGQFVPEQEPCRPNTASRSYAGQCFDGTDDRVILIDWLRTAIPDSRFSQCMSIPNELWLEESYGQYWLMRKPIDALESLRVTDESPSDISLEERLCLPLSKKAYDLHLQAEYDAENVITLSIFGNELTINMVKNEINANRQACPISVKKDVLDLRILVDTGSFEVFSDGGRFAFAAAVNADPNLPTLYAKAKKPLRNAKLEVYGLQSIWNESEVTS